MNARAARVSVDWAVAGARLLSTAEVERAVGVALGYGRRPGLSLAVAFVSDRRLARLHRRYLGDPSPTDVMAFDLGEEGEGPAGELYVSVECARRVARERGLPPDRELTLYVVHGCLHLCGFDDVRPRARARMRRAERRVLARLGFAPEGTGAAARAVFSRAARQRTRARRAS